LPPLPEAKHPENDPESRPLNPAAVGLDQLARLLGVPMDVLCRHVAQGAPTNANGSINLVHYAAWLNAPGGANPGQPVASGVDD
jgi:hypothetical protein